MWDRLLLQPLPGLICQLQPCHESSPFQLPVFTFPTGLDEYFFNSLVFELPYSLIFWQFWLFFVFKLVVVLLLVVGGGTIYLPMPPSWSKVLGFLLLFIFKILFINWYIYILFIIVPVQLSPFTYHHFTPLNPPSSPTLSIEFLWVLYSDGWQSEKTDCTLMSLYPNKPSCIFF